MYFQILMYYACWALYHAAVQRNKRVRERDGATLSKCVEKGRECEREQVCWKWVILSFRWFELAEIATLHYMTTLNSSRKPRRCKGNASC